MGGVTDYKTSSFSGRSNSMQVASFFGKGKLSGFILVTHLSLAEILLKNHVIFSDVFRCSIACR